jgi:hypothetical protein
VARICNLGSIGIQIFARENDTNFKKSIVTMLNHLVIQYVNEQKSYNKGAEKLPSALGTINYKRCLFC